jgi:hypothetical protein
VPSTIHRFGIRHHGPGSARALRAALDRVRPQCVLVEGPPDADHALPHIASPAMRPPVALMVHAATDPQRAVFYPFSHFSPEWVAIRWALEHAVPVRFIDLPIALQLGDDGPDSDRGDPLLALAVAGGYPDVETFWDRVIEHTLGGDPLAFFDAIALAMTALRETAPTPSPREARREAHMRQKIRQAERELFDVIAVVVGAWHLPALDIHAKTSTAKADQSLLAGLAKTKTEVAWIPWTSERLAADSGYGAGIRAPGWYAHLFDLALDPTVDRASAGLASDATLPDGAAASDLQQVATGWTVRAARLLRQADLDSSPAAAVESARLADALAALRGRSHPGLEELRDAILACLCHGEDAVLGLVQRELEVGRDLGEIPPDAPMTPLRRDFEAVVRRLRMKREIEATTAIYDLRKDLDRERVILLARLHVLDIAWGQRLQRSGELGHGTFKEAWQLAWDPRFEIDLALAARWGPTLDQAADQRLVERARTASLAELSTLLDDALPARLPRGTQALLDALDDRAATTADPPELARALPSLARVIRYSDVRETDPSLVLPVFEALFARLVVGLPSALALVDAAAAATLVDILTDVTQALALLASVSAPDSPVCAVAPAFTADWHFLLARLATDTHLQGLLRGRATRLLLEAGALGRLVPPGLQHLSPSDAGADPGPMTSPLVGVDKTTCHTPPASTADEDALLALASLSLSHALPEQAAAWVEGLVSAYSGPGSGLALLHLVPLWRALDTWLAPLEDELFVAVLPVLRRAFASFPAPERRQMGALIARVSNTRPGASHPDPDATSAAALDPRLDPARLAALRPLLATLFGPPATEAPFL